ncbi:hypothetical protein GOP47_0009855 [Adiantum capillus-veneris]|uniref:Uncharacterized protein n=1 Tax=Adiantum capillus-veneris TaxID=13818 RepID=A0A9D4UXM2_ADICA|nr:hypothetical protein GOP47_0009855 [Adiantum capillus-veneris]
MELRHSVKPKGSSSAKELVASSLVIRFGSSFRFVPPIWCASIQVSVTPASNDAVLQEVCMHEEANEDLKSSQGKIEVVGKAMVVTMQEEASQGVGQPCPTHCVEERKCILEGIGDVDLPKNEVTGIFFLLSI